MFSCEDKWISHLIINKITRYANGPDIPAGHLLRFRWVLAKTLKTMLKIVYGDMNKVSLHREYKESCRLPQICDKNLFGCLKVYMIFFNESRLIFMCIKDMQQNPWPFLFLYFYYNSCCFNDIFTVIKTNIDILIGICSLDLIVPAGQIWHR